MRVGVMALCSVMAGCLITPVMSFGDGKSHKQVVREDYVRVTPASFADHHEWTGPITTAKIRVYADDAYRAQHVHWQQSFQEQLDNANDVLAAMFGVKLVADYRPWSRHAPGATLSDTLEALTQLDDGAHALTVVALTSSLSLATATFEQLGVAHLGGRHLALRGYADTEERKVFDAAFTELRAEERDLLYQSRRRHKCTAILIHELAHNLGADHVRDPDTLMAAAYSERASAFDSHSQQIILAALDERLARRPAAVAAAKPVRHGQMIIGLDDAGHPLMGGRAIDLDTLDELLVMTSKDDPETEVVLRTTPTTPHAAVIDIIDHAKAAGLQRFALSGQ